MIQVVDTPQQWIPKNTFAYPPHQGLNPLIEERAFSYFTTMDIDSDYLYIPIQWTQYHCSHNWGNDAAMLSEMQRWADELPKKYLIKSFLL